MFTAYDKLSMPTPEQALPGRPQSLVTTGEHFVKKVPITPPYPEGMQRALFGMGCFWGAERLFWQVEGVYCTAVGYSAGYTPHPTYREVCSGLTGHNEVVLVVFDPVVVCYAQLLAVFWQSHNPTQGMRQGNDVGTQYRSGIYTFDRDQQQEAFDSLSNYGAILLDKGMGEITTEIVAASEFYFAEDYHQQYLAKNPGGYCGLGGVGIDYPVTK